MGQDISKIVETHVASIVHHGEKIILPSDMSLDTAIDILVRRKAYDEETVVMQEVFDVFPWDGANALNNIICRKYGWTDMVTARSMFGDSPPQLLQIEVGPNKKRSVPWGTFTLPGVDGSMSTGTGKKHGRYVFQLSAHVKRKDEKTLNQLFAELRDEINTNSIYKGQAIKIRFRKDDGRLLEMPEPAFMDTSVIDENMLVFSDDVMRLIEVNLFTPIKRARDCLLNGIPVKRGVLLGGTYGTGKTMAATVASKLAVKAGITYIYVPRADEISDAILFAKQYQSPAAVVFCEDIDRVVDGKRSVEMDQILNTIDGIDSKTSNIMVVLTTNELDSINPAMLRPGRLDSVIEVLPPDGKAVEKLLRIYSQGSILPETQLNKVGKILANNIPAVIAEVVKRAKLSQLGLQEPGTKVSEISEQALIDSANTIMSQVGLMERAIAASRVKPPTLADKMRETVHDALNGLHTHESRIQDLENTVNDN